MSGLCRVVFGWFVIRNNCKERVMIFFSLPPKNLTFLKKAILFGHIIFSFLLSKFHTLFTRRVEPFYIVLF